MDRLQVEGLAARLRDLTEAIPELELVVLFGSTVKGRRRPKSDVDLAVRCAGAADVDSLYLALAPRLGTARLDLVDLRRAGPLLMMEVARSGRLLYERRPGVFRQFQSLAFAPVLRHRAAAPSPAAGDPRVSRAPRPRAVSRGGAAPVPSRASSGTRR